MKCGCNRIEIDGVEPTNTKLTDLSMTIDLNQGFCNCSLRLPYQHHLVGNHWIEVEEHYDDCPHADPDRFISYLQD